MRDWEFLIGKWEGKTQEQMTDEGNIITSVEFDHSPSDKFIRARGEANNEKGLVNRSEFFLYEDPYQKRYLRKSIFSYGFINNEESYEFSHEIIKFNIKIEPNPKQWQNIRWRSYIKKISNTEIELALLQAKEDSEFEVYNKSIWTKLT